MNNYIYIVKREADGEIYYIYRLHVWSNNIEFYARFSNCWLRSSHTWASLSESTEEVGGTLKLTREFPHADMKEHCHVSG